MRQAQEMELIPDVENRLSDLTKRNLNAVIENRLNKEYDFLLLILGKGGDGKSMLASLACAYVAGRAGSDFNLDRIVFKPYQYREVEPRLKEKDCLLFDEFQEIFFSMGTAEHEQKEMTLKFASIRDRRFFIVGTTQTLFNLNKRMRGLGGDSKILCIWRVIRRGMFYSYSFKSGSLQRIRINTETNEIVWPEPDFVGFWAPIPKTCQYWIDYRKKKLAFQMSNKESRKVSQQREKIRRKMEDSVTIRDISSIHHVTLTTVRKWINKKKVFAKSAIFMDLSGKIRISMSGYKAGVERLEKMKMDLLKERKRHG